MDSVDFEKLILRAKADHPVWFGLEADPLATDEDIAVAERALGMRLPSKYCQFLRKYGGGYIAFSVVYSVSPLSDFNLVAMNQRERSLTGIPWIAISDNGCGDYYALVVNNEVLGDAIYFIDHDNPVNPPRPYVEDVFSFVIKNGLRSN